MTPSNSPDFQARATFLTGSGRSEASEIPSDESSERLAAGSAAGSVDRSADGAAESAERAPDPPEPPTRRFGRRVFVAGIDREGELLHRRQIASLLRQATAFAVRRAPYYGVLAAFPIPPQAIRPWRQSVRAELRRIEADGFDLARSIGAATLGDLVETRVERWPAASRLGQAARIAEDSEFARVCLGYALLCEGQAERARWLFAGLLRRSGVLRHRWRVLEGLALAHQALGQYRLALDAIESAAEDPRCGVSALVEGLHLALALGGVERVRRAAARIDMLVDTYAPEFSSAIERLRARERYVGLPAPSQDPEVLRLREELARADRSAAGRVAQLAG